MDPENLARTYRNLDEEQLISVALRQVRDLTPLAVQALKAEISRRNLSPDLSEAIDVQQALVDSAEVRALFDWYRTSPCPRCGKTGSLLNAYKSHQAGSTLMGVFTGFKVVEPLVVGCPACIRDSLGAMGEQLVFAEPTKEFIKFFQDNRGEIMMQMKRSREPDPG